MAGQFDLRLYQPQFPGYPVFVGLGAALSRLGLAPLTAAVAISSLSSATSGLALAFIARRLAGFRAAAAVLLLHGAAWQPWLLGGGALSESLALALAASSFALLLAERPALVASGLLAGLLLGARASYFPLLLSYFVLAFYLLKARRDRLRLLVGFAAGLSAWAAPFAALIGPHELYSLGLTHLRGHFSAWGGSIATRPGWLLRGAAFLRGLFYDGIAPSLPVLAALGGLLIGVALLERQRAKERVFPAVPLLLLAPYALWAFLGQNIVEQPRHLLPLVEGGLLLAACSLAPRFAAVLLATSLLLFVNAPLALARHRDPPAAVSAARWVLAQGAPATTLIAAGRSARFFRELAAPALVQEHRALSDLIGTLARQRDFPQRIFLTSEVDVQSGRGEGAPLPPHWRLWPGPTFCRDERIDRARPCLGISQLQWSF